MKLNPTHSFSIHISCSYIKKMDENLQGLNPENWIEYKVFQKNLKKNIFFNTL